MHYAATFDDLVTLRWLKTQCLDKLSQWTYSFLSSASICRWKLLKVASVYSILPDCLSPSSIRSLSSFDSIPFSFRCCDILRNKAFCGFAFKQWTIGNEYFPSSKSSQNEVNF